MRQQPFRTEDLKTALEKGLGFGLRPLERLGGASSLNFKAVRASDGFAFVVKCSPPGRHHLFERQAARLNDLAGTIAVQRLFEETSPSTFGDFSVMCLSWCPGRPIFPDRLTDEQFDRFLADYQSFSEVLQRIRKPDALQPLREWKREALAKSRGLGGLLLRRALRVCEDGSLTYCESLLKTIHYDLHHGNFMFSEGRLSGVIDFEETCRGYPAEDILRYLICAREHLRWYEFVRARRICHRFREAVCRLPYSREEWRLGVAARFLAKVQMKTRHRDHVGLLAALNLWWRSLSYRALLRDLTTLPVAGMNGRVRHEQGSR